MILCVIFFNSCVSTDFSENNESDTDDINSIPIVEKSDYSFLHKEFNIWLNSSQLCSKRFYAIDSTSFDMESELRNLNGFAQQRVKLDNDSSILGLNYNKVEIPEEWILDGEELSDDAEDTCIVLYSGILESTDKSVQYLVAYRPFLDNYFRVLVQRCSECTEGWKCIVRS